MVAPLCQFSVSSQHTVKILTLNPYISLCNLKLCITDGQKRDYLSRASSQQCARGATKK